MCYSIDFRKKVLSVREKENLTFKQTAVRFDIGIASITRPDFDKKNSSSRRQRLFFAQLFSTTLFL